MTPNPKCEFCGGTGEIMRNRGQDDEVTYPCHCTAPSEPEFDNQKDE